MKVLIAEDEPVSRRLLEGALTRWGYEVVTADNGLSALAILQGDDPPKLVMFDWLMPGLDGVQLCQAVRATKQEPYTYILMVTSKRSQENVVAGLSAGADDYITKPFDPDELRVRLRTGKRIVCLQDQLIAAREALREAATHDSLTGLWNRASIFNTLITELNRSDREHGSVGVVVIDLDNFKRINDTHGHLAGDEVLVAASHAIRKAVRPYDSVGRIGGEEFIVVMPGCDSINAISHAERIRAVIQNMVVDTNEAHITVTASLGVSVGGTETSAWGMVRAADEALYRAKHEGRNRVEFEPSHDSLSSVGLLR